MNISASQRKGITLIKACTSHWCKAETFGTFDRDFLPYFNALEGFLEKSGHIFSTIFLQFVSRFKGLCFHPSSCILELWMHCYFCCTYLVSRRRRWWRWCRRRDGSGQFWTDKTEASRTWKREECVVTESQYDGRGISSNLHQYQFYFKGTIKHLVYVLLLHAHSSIILPAIDHFAHRHIRWKSQSDDKSEGMIDEKKSCPCNIFSHFQYIMIFYLSIFKNNNVR